MAETAQEIYRELETILENKEVRTDGLLMAIVMVAAELRELNELLAQYFHERTE